MVLAAAGPRTLITLAGLVFAAIAAALGWLFAPDSIWVLPLTVVVIVAVLGLVVIALVLRRAAADAAVLARAVRVHRPGAPLALAMRAPSTGDPADFTLSGLDEFAAAVGVRFALVATPEGLELWGSARASAPSAVIEWTRLDDIDVDDSYVVPFEHRGTGSLAPAIVCRYLGPDGARALELPILAEDGRGFAPEDEIRAFAVAVRAVREAALPSGGAA